MYLFLKKKEYYMLNKVCCFIIECLKLIYFLEKRIKKVFFKVFFLLNGDWVKMLNMLLFEWYFFVYKFLILKKRLCGVL